MIKVNNTSFLTKDNCFVGDNSFKPTHVSGVYMLYNKYDQLIYVGQTKNLRTRLNDHCKNENKEWIYAYIIPISYKQHRDFIEAIFIKNLKPLNNKSKGYNIVNYSRKYLTDLQIQINEANKQIDFILEL